jgi:cell division control protein 7
MTTAVHRRPVEEPFDIHEDVRTEETEVMDDEDGERAEDEDHAAMDEDEEEQDDDFESSDDEQVDRSVQADMDKLAHDFPGIYHKYRLIKRIGEGPFPIMDQHTL